MRTVTFIFRRLRGSRILYATVMLMVVVSALMTLLTPYIIRIIVDFVLSDKLNEAPEIVTRMIAYVGGVGYLRANLWICGLIIIGSTLLNGVTMYFQGKLRAMASEKISKRLRDDLFSHIQRLPYNELVKLKTGDFIQRCTSDVDTVRRFLSMQFVEMGRTVIMVCGIVFIMLSQSVRLTLVSVPLVPCVFLFSFLFFVLVRNAYLKTDEAEGEMMTVLQENLTGIRVVRAFGRQRHEIDKFENKSKKFRDLDLILGRLVSYFWSISECMCLTQMGAILIVGAIWAVSGEVTLGTVLLFLNYETQLLWPIRQLGQILADMGRVSVSVSRLREIFDIPAEDMRLDGKTPEITGAIEFKNVCFEYEDGAPILKDISFRVEKGWTVAIVGPTGAGKTTLINLLSALYNYTTGSLTFDGHELKEINKEWIRKHVGAVEQETFLYSKPVIDNIKMACRSADNEAIIRSAKVAEIHSDIEEFTNGYDTVVGERGMTLSGGQKQRIAIARTIVGDYPILVFDDSLSSVDTETDAAVRRALRKRGEGVTTFIIAHRITTLCDADIILVLEDGRITNSGTHSELIKQDGLYKRIWEIQSKLEGGLEHRVKNKNLE